MCLDAVTVDEVLNAPGRRHMGFFIVADQLECRPEFVMETVRVVLDDRQAAALRWSIRCESRDDHMAARFDGPHHLLRRAQNEQ